MLVYLAKRIIIRCFNAVGLEVHKRKVTDKRPQREGEINQVMPDISLLPGLQRLIATRLQHPFVLLGSEPDLSTYRAFLKTNGTEWNWDVNIVVPGGLQVVICSLPQCDEHWYVIRELKRRHGVRITTIEELVLPFTPILFSQAKLSYWLKTIDEIAPFYLGEKWFGPIDSLTQVFPLSGKRVIEFGPFDGAQTAGLVHHGVRELVCIEARAENFIKTLIAKEVFGWNNIRIVMDDMHNADVIKYGRFDLAFCHGTYYHAMAPFVLLENLISLSDNIFVGGFVLKEGSPFEVITYEGEDYRVKPYTEGEGFTSGINKTSYYFHPDDLTRFFTSRGYEITVLDDREDEHGTNRYYRFFASR